MDNHERKIAALKLIVELSETIIAMVKASNGPMGLPGGHIYIHVMNVMTADEFEAFMDMIVKSGFLRKSGQCYFWVKDMYT